MTKLYKCSGCKGYKLTLEQAEGNELCLQCKKEAWKCLEESKLNKEENK